MKVGGKNNVAFGEGLSARAALFFKVLMAKRAGIDGSGGIAILFFAKCCFWPR